MHQPRPLVFLQSLLPLLLLLLPLLLLRELLGLPLPPSLWLVLRLWLPLLLWLLLLRLPKLLLSPLPPPLSRVARGTLLAWARPVVGVAAEAAAPMTPVAVLPRHRKTSMKATHESRQCLPP